MVWSHVGGFNVPQPGAGCRGRPLGLQALGKLLARDALDGGQVGGALGRGAWGRGCACRGRGVEGAVCGVVVTLDPQPPRPRLRTRGRRPCLGAALSSSRFAVRSRWVTAARVPGWPRPHSARQRVAPGSRHHRLPSPLVPPHAGRPAPGPARTSSPPAGHPEAPTAWLRPPTPPRTHCLTERSALAGFPQEPGRSRPGACEGTRAAAVLGASHGEAPPVCPCAPPPERVTGGCCPLSASPLRIPETDLGPGAPAAR